MSLQDGYTTIRKIEVGLIEGRTKTIYAKTENEQRKVVDELKKAIGEDSFFENGGIIIIGRYIKDIESSTQRVKVASPRIVG
ncbi:hypothetical protein D3C74_208140 [compost metagenome]